MSKDGSGNSPAFDYQSMMTGFNTTQTDDMGKTLEKKKSGTENKVTLTGAMDLLRKEVDIKTITVMMASNYQWGGSAADEVKSISEKVLSGEPIKADETSRLDSLPLGFGSITEKLKLIATMPSFFGSMRIMERQEDLETYLFEEKNIGGSFYFGSAPEALALGLAANMQGAEFKQKIDESIKSSKFFNGDFDSNRLNLLMLYDPKIGIEYAHSKDENWSGVGEIVKYAAGNSKVLDRLSPVEKQVLSLVDQEGMMSISVYDFLVRCLRAHNVEIPPDQGMTGRLDKLAKEKRLLSELGRERSPYQEYLPKIVLEENGEETLDKLMYVVASADIGFLMAMQARVLTQPDLIDRINVVRKENSEAGVIELVGLEEVVADLKDVYKGSAEHTGVSDVVERFLENGKERTFTARGNTWEGCKSIFRTGCYAQEMIPYVQVTPNYLPGHLNGIPMELAGVKDISKVINQPTLKMYMEGSETGVKIPGVIMIFEPNEKSLKRTVYQKDHDRGGMERSISLTLVGMDTTELAAVVLGESVTRDEMMNLMYQNEKYIPTYDVNGQLLIPKTDYQELLKAKKYQSMAELLESPPIEGLKDRKSGHGDDSLYDHTMRVKQKVDKNYPGDECGFSRELSEVAALLHDVRKGDAGQQQDVNVQGAIEILKDTRGLSLRDKEMVRMAIFFDDVIGAEVLANFDDLTAGEEDIRVARAKIESVFTDSESLNFALCLYIADVAGIGEGEMMMDTWRVKEKLTKLGLWNFRE